MGNRALKSKSALLLNIWESNACNCRAAVRQLERITRVNEARDRKEMAIFSKATKVVLNAQEVEKERIIISASSDGTFKVNFLIDSGCESPTFPSKILLRSSLFHYQNQEV